MAAPRKSDKQTKPMKAAAAPTPADRQKAISAKTGPAIKAPAPAKTTSGRRPAVDKTTGARRAMPAMAGGGSTPKGAFWLTCRECHEDWTLDPARAAGQEVITCPVCEHKSQPPNDDILHQIALYKGMEAGYLRNAVISLLVGLAGMLAFTLLTADPQKAVQPAFFYGPLAAGVLGLIGTLFFGAKYENSRWDTYF